MSLAGNRNFWILLPGRKTLFQARSMPKQASCLCSLGGANGFWHPTMATTLMPG